MLPPGRRPVAPGEVAVSELAPTGRPAVFLDRDGVINYLVPDHTGAFESPLSPEDVRLADGAPGHIDRLRRAGFLVLCVTNQPAAAKGTITLEQVGTVHRRVMELLEQAGTHIDGDRVCVHHPAGVVPGLARACDCRKPAPGMLLSLAEQFGADLTASWMIGDTDTDVGAGEAAGTSTILVLTPESAPKRSAGSRPGFVARDLGEAVSTLLAHVSRESRPAASGGWRSA